LALPERLLHIWKLELVLVASYGTALLKSVEIVVQKGYVYLVCIAVQAAAAGLKVVVEVNTVIEQGTAFVQMHMGAGKGTAVGRRAVERGIARLEFVAVQQDIDAGKLQDSAESLSIMVSSCLKADHLQTTRKG
jgi:hypothetical protein